VLSVLIRKFSSEKHFNILHSRVALNLFIKASDINPSEILNYVTTLSVQLRPSAPVGWISYHPLARPDSIVFGDHLFVAEHTDVTQIRD
jgi:hypothetical protein